MNRERIESEYYSKIVSIIQSTFSDWGADEQTRYAANTLAIKLIDEIMNLDQSKYYCSLTSNNPIPLNNSTYIELDYKSLSDYLNRKNPEFLQNLYQFDQKELCNTYKKDILEILDRNAKEWLEKYNFKGSPYMEEIWRQIFPLIDLFVEAESFDFTNGDILTSKTALDVFDVPYVFTIKKLK